MLSCNKAPGQEHSAHSAGASTDINPETLSWGHFPTKPPTGLPYSLLRHAQRSCGGLCTGNELPVWSEQVMQAHKYAVGEQLVHTACSQHRPQHSSRIPHRWLPFVAIQEILLDLRFVSQRQHSRCHCLQECANLAASCLPIM